jgi:predicted GNAT superfamily acetyltransferase
MIISRIEKNDFETVLLLNAAAVPHVNLIDERELEWFVEHSVCALATKIDEQLAGFMIGLRPGTQYQSANYRWFCEHYDDFAYVDRIVVADWAQRRGIAEALYREFAQSQSDAPVMTCEVNLRPANEGSMKFHQRMGFKQVASQEVDDGNKEVALLEKTL